jgi:hypothetical protein
MPRLRKAFPESIENSSIVYLLLILLLQDGQIGRKFPMLVRPPLLTGIL